MENVVPRITSGKDSLSSDSLQTKPDANLFKQSFCFHSCFPYKGARETQQGAGESQTGMWSQMKSGLGLVHIDCPTGCPPLQRWGPVFCNILSEFAVGFSQKEKWENNLLWEGALVGQGQCLKEGGLENS